MAFFCKNAQEEALKGIEKQMAIANALECLRELHKVGAISDENYAEEVRNIERHVYK